MTQPTLAHGPVTSPTTGTPNSTFITNGPQGLVRYTYDAQGKLATTTPLNQATLNQANQASDPNLSASAIISQTLASYGLTDPNLAAWALSTYQQSNSMDYVWLQLPQQPAFQAIYPAYQQMASQHQGFSIADYQTYNKEVAQLTQQYGMPAGFATPDRIATWLTNGVTTTLLDQQFQEYGKALQSPALQERLTANGLDPSHMTPGDLAAFLTDPKQAQPLLEAKFQQAQIGAASDIHGISISAGEAQTLQQAGITPDQANTTFTQLGQQQQLLQALPGSAEQAISNDQAASGATGADSQAALLLQQRQKERLAQFQGGGGFDTSQGSFTGVGTARPV